MNLRYPVPAWARTANDLLPVADIDKYSVYYDPNDAKTPWMLVQNSANDSFWMSAVNTRFNGESVMDKETFDRIRAITNLLYP